MVIKVRKLTREERNARIVTEIRNIAGANAPPDLHRRVKKNAVLVAADMAAIFGGDWQVRVDFDRGYVLVAPRPALE